MSSVPETHFRLPTEPIGFFSRLWEWFFGPTKSTNDSKETSILETRMVASKKCKPWSRTRPSHGWECERESRVLRPSWIDDIPRVPEPEGPSMMDLHKVPDTEGPRRRLRPNMPVCEPEPWNRNPYPLNDPFDPLWDDLPRVPGSSFVEAIGDVVVRAVRAVKNAVVRVVTHPKMPYVAGALAVGVACYYAYKWWCPETAASVTD